MTEKIKSNGERPQGDLISREALKKSFEDTVCIEPMPYAFVKQIIDNAPTVELRMGRMTNGVIIPIERPQGEWVDCGEYYKCPFCENWVLTADGKPKFCDECGADMRGKDNGKNL